MDVAVQRLKMGLMLVLALLWAPITWHCQLEAVSLLKFLACCDHEESAAPHQDDDCDTDACAVVESGDYKTPEPQLFVSPPALASLRMMESIFDAADADSQRIAARPVPEAVRPWQFTFRTALLPRAPSFVS
jgi:hypothetical protein